MIPHLPKTLERLFKLFPSCSCKLTIYSNKKRKIVCHFANHYNCRVGSIRQPLGPLPPSPMKASKLHRASATDLEASMVERRTRCLHAATRPFSLQAIAHPGHPSLPKSESGPLPCLHLQIRAWSLLLRFMFFLIAKPQQNQPETFQAARPVLWKPEPCCSWAETLLTSHTDWGTAVAKLKLMLQRTFGPASICRSLYDLKGPDHLVMQTSLLHEGTSCCD